MSTRRCMRTSTHMHVPTHNQVAQTFDACFRMRASWIEPRLHGLQPGTILHSFDFENWKDPQHTIQINPTFRFHTVDEPQLSHQKLMVSVWRKGPSGETVMEYHADVRGAFRDELELQRFPFDVMDLKVIIGTI